MYDFANSGYTTVVLTAVFNAYFVGVVAGGADCGDAGLDRIAGALQLLVMLTMPAIGAHVDARAAKKSMLMASTVVCILSHGCPGLGSAGHDRAGGGRGGGVQLRVLHGRVAGRGLPAGTSAARGPGQGVGMGFQFRVLRRHGRSAVA
jgi:hypothetical protein